MLINDTYKLEYFSGLNIKKAYSNTGIIVSQLTFTTPKPFVADRAAKVNIDVLGATDFFIASRKLSKGVYTVNCYDRCALLDIEIDLTDAEKDSEYIAISTILSKCREKVGFKGAYGLPNWCIQMHTAEVINKTYAQVLTTISEAVYGVWCVTSGEILQFVPHGYYTQEVGVEEHTALDIDDVSKQKQIITIDNEGNRQVKGTGQYSYEIVELQSSLYSCNTGYLDDIYNRVVKGENNFGAQVSRSAMSCSRAILSIVPDGVALYDFKQYPNISFAINNIDIDLSRSGIYATLTFDSDVDELATRSRLSRVVDEKVTYGLQGKNAVMSKFQGLVYTEEKEPGDEDARL